MDIRRILEAKKKEIEAKLREKNVLDDDFPSSTSSPAISVPFVNQSSDGSLSAATEELIDKLARDVSREGTGVEDRLRGDYSSHGQPYEFLLHPTSPEYQLYQAKLSSHSQASASRKRQADEETSPSAEPTQLKKRSSRWGPQPVVEAAPAVPSLTEEEMSALQLAHLRQQLVAKDMALTAKAGVVEMQLGMGLPSAEHRMRALEMEKTKEKAKILTKSLAEGKHHMQDFLPKEELAKFIKTRDGTLPATAKAAQYEENKLTESNVGFKMLQKYGWSEGKGLGSQGTGIAAPISNVAPLERAGLGTSKPDEPSSADDEFELYRKRMMTAYKYRPNPLNNPRRPYY